jgi:hypothetical protein
VGARVGIVNQANRVSAALGSSVEISEAAFSGVTLPTVFRKNAHAF